MEKEIFSEAFKKILAGAWFDDRFKAKLLADPIVVFKENGIELPEGVEVKVLENTEKVIHLTLPPKPDASELSDDDLDKVAGGLVDSFEKKFGLNVGPFFEGCWQLLNALPDAIKIEWTSDDKKTSKTSTSTQTT